MSRARRTPAAASCRREYSHTLDPFAALARARPRRNGIKIGTGICLVIERDPIVTAKEVATARPLSGGRFLFGVGAGWNREEMENHGTDQRTRFTRMRESDRGDEGDLDRRRGRVPRRDRGFRPIWSLAEAGREAAPAVLVEGTARRCSTAWSRTATSGSRTAVKSPEELGAPHRRAPAPGRGGRARPIPVTVFGAKSEVRLLERLRDAGSTRAPSTSRPGKPDEVDQALDRLAGVAAEWDG